MNSTGAPPSFESCLRIFRDHGGTDTDYLRLHWPRFVATKAIFEQDWKRRDVRLLDLGAHWLHQSLVFALDGYRVTAGKVPRVAGSWSRRPTITH